MKIYIDDANKVIGYEVVFYDKKKDKRPITKLETGVNTKEIFLNEKQNKFIINHTDKGGKITQLIYNKDGTFTINNEVKSNGDCVKCNKTVLVSTKHYKPNSDLQRHFKDAKSYTFSETDQIPFDHIKDKYLYYFDKSIIELEKSGRSPIDKSLKRYFILKNKNGDLVAFIYLIRKELPIITVLYHDEEYDNAGYIILNNLIELFKKQGEEYLDLGGLTRVDSGINQFKNKFGVIMPTDDRKLFVKND